MTDAANIQSNPNGRAVVVTGATSALARQLIQHLYYHKDIRYIIGTAVGPRPYYFEEYSRDKFAYTQVDLTKERQVSNLFYSDLIQDIAPDTVAHLAFKGRPDQFDERAHKLNIDALSMLLDKCVASRDIRKFIYRSSHQVYRVAPDNAVFLDEHADINFENKSNPWIADRVDADMLCRSRMDTDDLDIVVLRMSNLIGQSISSQLNALLQSAVTFLPMGFDPMINLLHPRDAVRAIHAAIEKPVRGVFNIDGRETAPLSVIARLSGSRVIRAPGSALGLLWDAESRMGATQYVFRAHRERLWFGALLDGTRAKEELGYAPVHHVELG